MSILTESNSYRRAFTPRASDSLPHNSGAYLSRGWSCQERVHGKQLAPLRSPRLRLPGVRRSPSGQVLRQFEISMPTTLFPIRCPDPPDSYRRPVPVHVQKQHCASDARDDAGSASAALLRAKHATTTLDTRRTFDRFLTWDDRVPSLSWAKSPRNARNGQYPGQPPPRVEARPGGR